MKKRELKIGYRVRTNVFRELKLVPEIKLAGNWLEQAGFAYGDEVEVVVEQGKLIIRNYGKV